MMQSKVEQTYTRIITTEWKRDFTRVNSQLVLVREYLRRAALWAKTLEIAEKCDREIVFDIAFEIDPEVRASNDAISKLEAHLRKLEVSRWLEQACLYALHWCALLEQKESVVVDYGLPDPYEPLLLAYERGADMYPEHGLMILVNGYGIYRQKCEKYSRYSPLEDLTSEALDKLDKLQK
jgi:hypothetical protein